MKFITSNNLTYVLSTLKTKNDALYAPKDHNHEQYLLLTGGLVTGNLQIDGNLVNNNDATFNKQVTFNDIATLGAGAKLAGDEVQIDADALVNNAVSTHNLAATFNGDATFNSSTTLGAGSNLAGDEVQINADALVNNSPSTHNQAATFNNTVVFNEQATFSKDLNAQGIKVGNDAVICDRNITNHIVIEGGTTATMGGITFGSGKDTNIYRGGANILKTDDSFNCVGGYYWNGQSLDERYAAKSHGTHLTIGTGSGNAFRGDYGNTAYNHSQAAHAPSNAQKNSDITKAEIEAKLTGNITTHKHNSITAATGSSWTGTAVSNTTDCLINFYSHISKSATGLFSTGDNSNAIISINRHEGSYDSQLGFNSQGGIFYRYVDGTAMANNTTWYRVYTSLDKPTPADIGAAAASHGTHLTIGTGASNAAAGNHTHKYAGSSSAGGTANSVNGYTIWVGTQAQYNAISSKSSTTLYFIKE
jgi:hypothetical protein